MRTDTARPIPRPILAPVGNPFDAAGTELAALEALEVGVGRAEASILHNVDKANSDQNLGIVVQALYGL